MGQLLSMAGDAASARKAFEAALAASPGLATSELALAELDTKEGKSNDARQRLTKLLAAHPESVAGRLLFAQLETRDAKPAAAMEQYQKALALDSKNALALNGLAYHLAQAKQPDEALKYAQQAKQLLPESAAVDDTLGWTYFQKGMYPLAVTYLEGATAKEATALRKYHLAMAYLKAGDPKRGRQVFESALKMDPNLPEAQEAKAAFSAVRN
jgi:Tfp pilus assembly protein PilF